MPLFNRPDGDVVEGQSPVRTIMPYLMRGRNESFILHDMALDVSRTLPWLKDFNAPRPEDERATLFQLYLWACARALHARPGLNRFVSGGRIYQRNEVSISFAAKKAMRDDAPIVTIKRVFPKDEPFDACIGRIRSFVREGRSGKARAVDTEVNIATKLPGIVLKAGVHALRALDGLNLVPGAMLANDPMYASLFAANLGSVGIDDVAHHLYEYGTCSVFGVVGRVKKTVFVGEDDQPVVRDGLKIRWTFDERINDGLYCAASLGIARQVLEDPASVIGEPA
jgi:pyruvate/2-oxoglutarate dehydrogenase complex dihydrolipoamide acyltransferase (E2) component